jgi:hypothetical protein
MDEERFDSLARQLGALTSRRQVLRGLVGALAGALTGAGRLSGDALQSTAVDCNVEQCLKNAEQVFVKDVECAYGIPSSGAGCGFKLRYALERRTRAFAKCRLDGCGLDRHCTMGICCGIYETNCKGACAPLTCPANQVFNRDSRDANCCECPPDTYLCPSGGGQICMSVPCPAGKKPNPTTCVCECSNKCPSDQVPDPDDCTCRCPGISCPAGQSLDPQTCKCTNVCIKSGGCDSNIDCNPAMPGCKCATTTEGAASCVQSGLCEDKQLCLKSVDCPPGFACIPDNCCPDGIPRCGPICQATASTDLADRDQLGIVNGSARFLQRAEPARSVQASFYE